jgi:hypothetical protein
LLRWATVGDVGTSRRVIRSIYTVLSMSFFALGGVALVVVAVHERAPVGILVAVVLLAAAGVYALVQAVRELLGYSSWWDGEL